MCYRAFFVFVIPAGMAVFIHTYLSGMTINYHAQAERHRVNKLKGKKGVLNMTRNDIKALFPDAPKEAIDQLLDINSTDIGKAVNKGQTTQEQLEAQVKSLNDQVKTLTEQNKALNADVTEKDKQIKTLTTEKETAINNLNAQHEVDLKTLKTQHESDMTALNDQLKAAQDKATVADTLTERVAQLTKDVADRDATIAKNDKQYRIKDELRGLHARNVDVIWPLLNLEKIEEKDGKLEGLTEQVEALKQSDAYLFDTNTGNQRGGFPGTQDTGGELNGNAAINAAIRSMSGRG